MILTTTETISGRELETLGLVQGSTIQSKHVGHDIAESFKTLIGGELNSYTEMMNKARAIATDRMINQATQWGADAIVCVRYTSSEVTQGAAEVICYGTAVKFR
ncbi:MAG: YbjQ family protein [Ruminococcus sp.]|nr:YbjQ family protein [Ruminococcus sp.]MBQ8904907.1 YbjQ family protein [Ruminococcus sp.]